MISKDDKVYVLCMPDYGDVMGMFGIFTDKEKLMKYYHEIVQNDDRCVGIIEPRLYPEIYEFALNEFVAEWDGSHYWDKSVECKIEIQEL